MKTKRLFSAILAVLMLMAGAVSCSDKTPSESASESESKAESSSESASESGSAAESVAETNTTTYYNDMEAVNYDGWEMRVASDANASYCFRVLTVEELGVDEFSDMLYNRQIAVEDKYRIKIVEEQETGELEKLVNSVLAQTRDYSLAYAIIYGEIDKYTDNIAIGVSDMPVFDLTKPYWDQGAIESLSINDKMYYGLSDIGFSHYESNCLLFYNGVILNENHLESPYDLYRSGKWTVDKMYEMMTAACKDENGNGTMEEGDDIFGFVGRHGDLQAFVASSGEQILSWDSDEGNISVNFTDERVLKIGEATKKLLLDTNVSRAREMGLGGDAGEMFKNGKALFFGNLLGYFRNLRSVEDDYGIINFPSIDENMTGGSYCINPEGFFIASDCEDQERLATVIEAMNAYSYDYVLEAYIQKTVIGKGARDQQSAEIVRENFSTRSYCLAEALGLESVVTDWKAAVRLDTYASLGKISEKKVSKTVSRVVDALSD